VWGAPFIKVVNKNHIILYIDS